MSMQHFVTRQLTTEPYSPFSCCCCCCKWKSSMEKPIYPKRRAIDQFSNRIGIKWMQILTPIHLNVLYMMQLTTSLNVNNWVIAVWQQWKRHFIAHLMYIPTVKWSWRIHLQFLVNIQLHIHRIRFAFIYKIDIQNTQILAQTHAHTHTLGTLW